MVGKQREGDGQCVLLNLLEGSHLVYRISLF